MELHSDGSVTAGECAGCGVAWKLPSGEWQTAGFKLPVHCTPVQAELMGILQAGELVKLRLMKGAAYVCTDCLRAIDYLAKETSGCHSGCTLALAITERLGTLGVTVRLRYTPSKSSIGNLKADAAARAAAHHGPAAPLKIPFTQSALARTVHKWLMVSATEAYEKDVRSLGRSLLYFVPTMSALRALCAITGGKNLWMIVCGRNQLRYSRSKIDHGSSVCPFCDSGEEEDFHHFRQHWIRHRRELLAALRLRGIQCPPPCGDILLKDRALVQELEKFIGGTGRLQLQ
ncbi:hypothetical protein FOZ60_002967 [Perkinsus olseni]|uniref:Uncharacterized protein n=1 Tax=Perkinsus olseni TaxID=32597 RepID=A0A7J6NWV6_PEROL|nr:hypothetical protein FOZ60_002967 [Perkinsus olseni]